MEYTEEESDIILQYSTPTIFDGLLSGMVQGSSSAPVNAIGEAAAFLTGTDISDSIDLHEDLPDLLERDIDPLSLVVLRNTNTTKATDSIFLSEALQGVTSSITDAGAVEDHDLLAELDSLLKLADDELQRKDYHYYTLGDERRLAEAYVLGIDEEEAAYGSVRCRSPGMADKDLDGEHIITREEMDDISEIAGARIRCQDTAYATGDGKCSAISVQLYEGEATEDIQERIELAQQHCEALCHREVYSDLIAQNIKAAISDNCDMVVKELVALERARDQEVEIMEQNKHSASSDNTSHRIKSIIDRISVPASKAGRALPAQYYDPYYLDKLSKAALNDENELEIIKHDIMPLSSSSMSPIQCMETSVTERLIPINGLTDTNAKLCTLPQAHHAHNSALSYGGDATSLGSTSMPHTVGYKKNLSREKWLLLKEAKEMTSMRREDELAQRLHRINEASNLSKAKERQQQEDIECSSRLLIVGEESIEIEDLLRRKERQKGLIMQYLLFNFEQHKTRALMDTIHGEAEIRENTENMEECEFSEKINFFIKHSKEITRRDYERGSLVHEGLISIPESISQDEEDERERLARENCRGESHAVLLMTERVAEEKKTAVAHIRSENIKRREELSHFADVPSLYARLQKFNEMETTAVADELYEAISSIKTNKACNHQSHHFRESVGDQSMTSPVTLQHNTSHSRRDITSSKDDIILNADLFHVLHPSNFAVSDGSPSAATVAFRTISCALESISELDFGSISRLTVNVHKQNMTDEENEKISRRPSSAAVAKLRGMRERQLPISPMVEQLDLSNNVLSFLPRDKLLSTFPSLRKLTIANNKIIDFVSDCETLQTYPKLVDLDISANGVTGAANLSAFPNMMRLVAYANQIKLVSIPLPHKGTSNIQVIELSRNELNSLSNFNYFPKLSSLDVSRNQIEDLAPVLNSSIFLQRLYVSHNNITELPSEIGIGCSIRVTWKCIFLRQLFISDNGLVHLGPIANCPFLTVLHAESNRIECIEGVRGCPLLQIIDLSFNALATWESLLPLSHCKEASSVAINDNPLENPSDIHDVYIDPKELVMKLCPKLKELNNDLLQHSERYRLGSCCTSKGAVIQDAIEKRRILNIPNEQYELLLKLDIEYRAVCKYYNRRHQRALMAERVLTKSLKETKNSKLTSLLRDSVTAWMDNQLGITFLLVKHLNIMKKFISENGILHRSADGELLEDIFSFRIPSSKLLQNQLTVCAASIVRDAVRGWILIRRAKAQLLHLKTASSATQHSGAATKIQSVWRGAIVRRRLHKVFLNDDSNFEKVEWSNLPSNEDKVSVTNVLKGAFDAHGSPKVFEICKGTMQEGVLTRSGSEFVELARISTPQLERKHADFRPSSQPVINVGVTNMNTIVGNTNTSVAGIPSPCIEQANTTNEWSLAIQAHIKMKKHKSNIQRQENMRKEFISDPLRAKQKFGK